ncbi:hypothetical protein [Streptomyces antarcticus]|uniref:hypothetical protein n=1 Tax=Streptomyces antarcticus TaxID=2996458 RepID=UPI0022719C02|nr:MULTISPECIES: hypothetical protein [unclassified Streptomyces]MCY0943872.1 hypothetical protein [Streptomyces sp. H34-AA3]MCZ4086176.1 hypothetical protein [Streptomyces sp. H34-S5]
MSENPAPMRATRAALFAAVCVALGAVGHAHMSGTDVPLAGLLGAFGATAGLAWLGAGRRRGPVGITAALLAVQGVLHLVFTGSQAVRTAAAAGAGSGDGMAGMAGMADMAGMAHGGSAAGPGAMVGMVGMAGVADLGSTVGAGAMDGLAGMVAMAGHGGVGMLAAHVLAGLFCALWLARGEAAVFRLARVLGSAALHTARPLARAVALVRARVVPAPAPPAPRPAHVRPRRLRGAVHAHAVVRRGPPETRAFRTTAPGRPARA